MKDSMQLHIGTKQVTATPMTRLAYNEYRGWTLPADEDGADDGYLVEYLDGGKPNHPSHVGYISWSPKAQFDAAYRPTTGMSFGLAIEALKLGKRVARAGWNGKGMWLALSCDGEREVAAENFWSPHNAQFARENGGTAIVLPSITMKTTNAHGRVGILMGWLASQTDMLSDDWVVAE